MERIHRVRRSLEAEKQRRGLSELQWLEFIEKRNAARLVSFLAGRKKRKLAQS